MAQKFSDSSHSPHLSKRVRQQTSAENWLRRALILLTLLWLTVTVVLPVSEVLDRSLHAQVPVTIFGKTDVRIGGRWVYLDAGKAFIDTLYIKAVDGKASYDGMTVTVQNNTIRAVACEKIILYNTPVVVPAIRVTIDANHFMIDGQVVSEQNLQREVRRWIGTHYYRKYFANPALYYSLYNSLFVSLMTTAIAVILAFIYAYALTRTTIPGKTFFRVVAMLPLYAPTMLYGLSLVYLFGNKGIITTGFFEKLPWLAFNIRLYGPVGIILAEIVFTFPSAFMILLVALASTDARLYEAAQSLRASKFRIFRTVTLPGIKFGLISAIFVCFTLCFTDFGAPKVVGGNYNILAVDVYKQVIGQQNFGMGATISIILLIPAVISFIADRLAQRRQVVAVTARSVPYTPKKHLPTDLTMLSICGLIAGFILLMLFTAGFASLVKIWPYNFTLGLKHYTFENTGGGGYAAFWNSVRMSIYTALFGTLITFVSAYLIEKTRKMAILRQVAYFLSIIPLALPGLVIGIAYIFFFNKPWLRLPLLGVELRNPFNVFYGTMAILIISNIIHFYTVSFLTATTALRQLDQEFETVAESMSVPFYKTFFRVTVPVCLPALLEIAMFFFVSSIATVSAVIFLYSADTKLASVAVVNMDDAGDTAPAAAMCMLIVFTNLLVRSVFEGINMFVKNRSQAWRTR